MEQEHKQASQSKGPNSLNFELLRNQNQALVARLRCLKQKMASINKQQDMNEQRNNNAVNLVDCFLDHLKKVASVSYKSSDSFVKVASTHCESDEQTKILHKFQKEVVDSIEDMLRAIHQERPEKEQLLELVRKFNQKKLCLFEEISNLSQQNWLDAFSSLNTDDEKAKAMYKVTIEKNKALEEENINRLKEIDSLKNEFELFKTKNQKTEELLQRIKDLEVKNSNYLHRIEKLTQYTSETVKDVLENDELDLEYSCICGSALFQDLKTVVCDRRKNLENVITKLNTAQATSEQRTNDNKQNGETMEEEETPEIKHLRKELEKAYLEIERVQIDKATLDERFQQSELFTSLVEQVKGVLSYSTYLKSRTEKAEKTIYEIEGMRRLELEEILEKHNEEKMKSTMEHKLLSNEIEQLKEKNNFLVQELDKAAKNRAIENRKNDPRNQPNDDEENKDDHNQKLVAFIKEIKTLKEEVEYERKRCFKYEREIINVKENYYNKLLSKYEDCGAITLRHSRHSKLTKLLLELNEKHNLGIKEVLEEFIKYLKGREDKIGFLEKKLKKKEKECEQEKHRGMSFLSEIEVSAKSYLESQNEIESLKKEYAELNNHFNALFKEKNNEKSAFVKEREKLTNEIVHSKSSIVSQNGLLSDLRKKIRIQGQMINEADKAVDDRKMILEEAVKEETESKLTIKNQESQLILKEKEIVALNSTTKELAKKISNLEIKLAKKDTILNEFLQTRKEIAELDDSEISKEDFMFAKMEASRLRKIVRCNVCEEREIEVALHNCMHLFCSECINKVLTKRERKCPTCRIKIGHADVKKLYLK